MTTAEGEALGRWLGVLSRAVVGSVREEWWDGEDDINIGDDVDVGDWNVVQNNGTLSPPLYPIHISIFTLS